MRCGGPGQAGDQARVVLQLAIPVKQRAAQPRAAQRRNPPQRVLRGDALGTRKDAGAGTGRHPQEVAGVDPGCGEHGLRRGDIAGQRHEHRHRPDEVRRGALQQDSPFHRALVSDPQLPGGEIAQPAVDQLAGPARGTEGDMWASTASTDNPRAAASTATPAPVTPSRSPGHRPALARQRARR